MVKSDDVGPRSVPLCGVLAAFVQVIGDRPPRLCELQCLRHLLGQPEIHPFEVRERVLQRVQIAGLAPEFTLLRVQQPGELAELPLNQETRRLLLQAYLTFYTVQIPDFGEMRTVAVLQTILS